MQLFRQWLKNTAITLPQSNPACQDKCGTKPQKPVIILKGTEGTLDDVNLINQGQLRNHHQRASFINDFSKALPPKSQDVEKD